MSQPATAELVATTSRSSWRAYWIISPLLIFIGWLAISTRFGQVVAAGGALMGLDLLLVLWRSRGTKARLRVPTAGRVGRETKFQLTVDQPHAISWLTAPTKVEVSRPPTAAMPWAASHVHIGWSAANLTEHLPMTPMHRGRGWAWTVACTDVGLMGLPYRTRRFEMVSQQPFSVGPSRVRTSVWEPIEVSRMADREDGVDMQMAGGLPVLRQWRQGDRTAAIDWRRTERIDEMVVGVSEAHRPRVAVVANLGHPLGGPAIETAASNWATVAERWMAKADVVLVWNEQGATCVREIESPMEIDIALAGAEPGPFDRAVLAEVGVPKHMAAKL